MLRTVSLVAVVCVWMISLNPLFAQNTTAPKKDDKKGDTKTLLTKDNWSIPITYFESPKEKDAPVVVMLPGKGENRIKWNALAQDLHKQQYAVITVDLRKQGESKPGAGAPPQAKNSMVTKLDFEGMLAFDLEAVKKFLYDEHQAKRLNMRRLALIAADQSTAVAITYAAIDWAKEPFDDAPNLANRTPRGQDIQALVLLSPMDQVPGTTVNKVLPLLKGFGVGAMLAFGNTDKKAADSIYAGVGGPKQEGEEKKYISVSLDTKLRGTALLDHPVKVGTQNVALKTVIAGYLNKRIVEPDIEWRDRKSRLE